MIVVELVVAGALVLGWLVWLRDAIRCSSTIDFLGLAAWAPGIDSALATSDFEETKTDGLDGGSRRAIEADAGAAVLYPDSEVVFVRGPGWREELVADLVLGSANAEHVTTMAMTAPHKQLLRAYEWLRACTDGRTVAVEVDHVGERAEVKVSCGTAAVRLELRHASGIALGDDDAD